MLLLRSIYYAEELRIILIQMLGAVNVVTWCLANIEHQQRPISADRPQRQRPIEHKRPEINEMQWQLKAYICDSGTTHRVIFMIFNGAFSL